MILSAVELQRVKRDMMDPDDAPGAGGAASADPTRMSTVLRDLSCTACDKVSIARISEALGDRGIAAMLLLFAAINMLPLPPGTGLILGPPLIIIAIQMIIGNTRIWLPRSVLQKSVTAERFTQMVDRMLPRLTWLESVVRPRYWPFPSEKLAAAIIGGVSLILAVAVVVPIPFGNWLPAFALFIIAISLSERDGVVLAAGLVVGLASFAVIGGLVGAAGAVLFHLLG